VHGRGGGGVRPRPWGESEWYRRTGGSLRACRGSVLGTGAVQGELAIITGALPAGLQAPLPLPPIACHGPF
jgi:hypothetical protein